MIKAVVFDVDDTLYMRSEPYLAAFHEMYGERFDVDDDKLFEASRYWSDEEFYRVNRGEITKKQMYINRGVRTLAEVGIAMSDEEALHFQDLYTEKLDDIHLLPGMRRILEECRRRGLFLGIISNGVSERQRSKTRTLGVEQFIPEDHILITGDIETHKPDPRLFHIYEERFGLSPAETCYVGDNFRNDVQGPHDVGWQTAWILRKNLYTDEEVELARPWVGVMSPREEDLLRYILEE